MTTAKLEPLKIGCRTTRYQALLPIASGAMGTVHLGARSAGGGADPAVALKRLHGGLAGDCRARAMFCREAFCLRSIEHENVVRFVDYDTSGGAPTLVMEYVDGTTLSALALRGERLPVPVALAIALQICTGLEAIQTATDEKGRPLGIVHRDLCPQNIMVDVSGVVRIIDFGVARLGNDEDPGVFGKVSYMAPETLNSGIADSASDRFAMAVVLWELFAGRSFDDADVPSLKSAVGEHARVLDPIFARALGRRPSRRFASAGELRRALEQTGIVPADRKVVAAFVGCANGAAPAMPAMEEQDVVEVTEAEMEATPAPRPTWIPFDVDRPRSEPAVAPRPRRFQRALKWGGLFALAGAIAAATSALAQLAG